jgi:hypothetical protein
MRGFGLVLGDLGQGLKSHCCFGLGQQDERYPGIFVELVSGMRLGVSVLNGQQETVFPLSLGECPLQVHLVLLCLVVSHSVKPGVACRGHVAQEWSWVVCRCLPGS